MRPASVRFWLAALLAAAAAMPAIAQPPEDDPEALTPGLIAAYSAAEAGAKAPIAMRLDPDLTWDWGTGAPDPRVPADGFEARWVGSLLVQAPGPHRFQARTDGWVRVEVGGRVVLEGEADAIRSTPADLAGGLTPIVVAYRHHQGPARLAITWEGPGFPREPLPARLLFHERAQAANRTDRFEDGRRLADRLGCANCHTVLDLPAHPGLGPPLDDAGSTIDRGWLAAWLADPASVRPGPRMPGFGLDTHEVADLLAFLTEVAANAATTPVLTPEVQMALNVADPAKGRLLFRSVGCLGCHTRGDAAPDPDDRAAPDLADLGRQRSASWLASYLTHPKKSGAPARHRFDLRLSPDAAAHLAAYLVSDPPEPIPPPDLPRGDAARGRTLADRLRCASCHEIPGLKPLAADLPLRAGSNPNAGCLAEPPSGRSVPRFTLSSSQRAALRAFVAGLPARPSPTSRQVLAQDTIRRLHCLGCHARDGGGATWLGPQVAALLEQDPDLGALKGTLTPPNLSAVGDKLRPEYLAQALRGNAPSARPWLSVRMPSYPFQPGEAEAILAYFCAHDRQDPSPGPEPDEPTPRPDLVTIERGANLIGQRGFGCLSCHVLAGKIPAGGEPETLGPDLALAHRRMTSRYFRRWLADPQRIIPGTPMPQFLQPAPNHPGTLDEQLATIWALLSSDRLAEVAAQGTREVLKRQGDRALVVRDMVLVPELADPYVPRGLAIGLKNGQALLFDTDRLSWLAWWSGAFLYRTKSGRLWEWHPEGDRLWTAPERGAPLAFLDPDGRLVPPGEVRERFGSFTELAFAGDGVRLTYHLLGPQAVDVRVEERITPTADGWERLIRIENVPEGFRPALVERPPADAQADEGGAARRWRLGPRSVVLHAPATPPLGPADTPTWLIPLAPSGPRAFTGRLRLAVHGE